MGQKTNLHFKYGKDSKQQLCKHMRIPKSISTINYNFIYVYLMSSVLFPINSSFFLLALPLHKWDTSKVSCYWYIIFIYETSYHKNPCKKLKTTNNDMLLWTFYRKFIYSTFSKQEKVADDHSFDSCFFYTPTYTLYHIFM